jgi:hypothetical protein
LSLDKAAWTGITHLPHTQPFVLRSCGRVVVASATVERMDHRVFVKSTVLLDPRVCEVDREREA